MSWPLPGAVSTPTSTRSLANPSRRPSKSAWNCSHTRTRGRRPTSRTTRQPRLGIQRGRSRVRVRRREAGGTFRTYIDGFPLTLRRVGPDSNGSFAGYLRPNHFGPVALHPTPGAPIPALATHWRRRRRAQHLLPAESRGTLVRWRAGHCGRFRVRGAVHALGEIVAPWYNEYYTERIRDVRRYDDLTYGVQGANP